MKIILRPFFKVLRLVIGPLLLLWERLSRPRGLQREASAQARVDQACRQLVLYQYPTCPFCLRVRQEIARLALPIERRNARHEGPVRSELVRGGGLAKVPCLKITDPAGNQQWMYESAEIVAYLRQRFAAV